MALKRQTSEKQPDMSRETRETPGEVESRRYDEQRTTTGKTTSVASTVEGTK